MRRTRESKNCCSSLCRSKIREIQSRQYPGPSSLTLDAFQPNQIQLGVGDAVTWTNYDRISHTATSGQSLTPDGRFDSDIMAPTATFEHIFTEAGDFLYLRLVHPNMGGTGRVS